MNSVSIFVTFIILHICYLGSRHIYTQWQLVGCLTPPNIVFDGAPALFTLLRGGQLPRIHTRCSQTSSGYPQSLPSVRKHLMGVLTAGHRTVTYTYVNTYTYMYISILKYLFATEHSQVCTRIALPPTMLGFGPDLIDQAWLTGPC